MNSRPLPVTLFGSDRTALMRMQKRLRCAARGIGIDITIITTRDDIQAMDMGARHGPVAVATSSDGQQHILMHGAEQVEIIEKRMQQWFQINE